jgi:hypothetical protein
MVSLVEKVAARFAARSVKADSADVEQIRRLSEKLAKNPDLLDAMHLEKLLEKYSRAIRMANPGISQDAHGLSLSLGNLREHVKDDLKETLRDLDTMLETAIF